MIRIRTSSRPSCSTHSGCRTVLPSSRSTAGFIFEHLIMHVWTLVQFPSVTTIRMCMTENFHACLSSTLFLLPMMPCINYGQDFWLLLPDRTSKVISYGKGINNHHLRYRKINIGAQGIEVRENGHVRTLFIETRDLHCSQISCYGTPEASKPIPNANCDSGLDNPFHTFIQRI